MESCIHHDECIATHLLLTDGPHDGQHDCDTEPLCEGCADDYPPERIRPNTFYACHICGRDIERVHPAPPLCWWCETTAKAGGKQLAEAERQARGD